MDFPSFAIGLLVMPSIMFVLWLFGHFTLELTTRQTYRVLNREGLDVALVDATSPEEALEFLAADGWDTSSFTARPL